MFESRAPRRLQSSLILSLNQSFTLERLLRWSPVLLMALVHILIGAGLGMLAGRVLRLASPRRELLVLTTAYGNCGALPFVLVLPIVQQWPVTRDDPRAHETGLAVIGLYLVVWFCAFFSAGTWYAARIGARASGAAARGRRPLAHADAAAEDAVANGGHDAAGGDIGCGGQVRRGEMRKERLGGQRRRR